MNRLVALLLNHIIIMVRSARMMRVEGEGLRVGVRVRVALLRIVMLWACLMR